jgi:hypothetical protein
MLDLVFSSDDNKLVNKSINCLVNIDNYQPPLEISKTIIIKSYHDKYNYINSNVFFDYKNLNFEAICHLLGEVYWLEKFDKLYIN